MPLIEKSILIEGANGETLVKKYYVQEKARNPYGSPERDRIDRKKRKLRRLFAKKVPRNEKGYMWSLGYNHLAGCYSPGSHYSRFGGSSLNRNKQLYESSTNMEASERNTLAMARKAAKAYYQRGEALPDELRHYLGRQDSETEARFRDWLRTQVDLPKQGIFLPIHILSPRSRGKIKDKATAFFRACPGSRIFVTLTFVAPVDDSSGIAILNKFLTSLRKTYEHLQYLWVAERQENGNIHFHMIMNKRFSKEQLRRFNGLWVLQQYNAGLRGQTWAGLPISLAQVEQAFENGTVGKLFNPLDAKRVRSIAGLSAYLTKYITKQKKDILFACRPWHCSRGVSRMFTKAIVSPSTFRYMMSWRNAKLDKETGELFMPKMCRPKGPGAGFVILVFVNKKDLPLRYLAEMETINRWMMSGMHPDRMPVIDDDLYRSYFCKN